ncbi:MAG: cell surface protein SprA [Bacteroidota bacterium]
MIKKIKYFSASIIFLSSLAIYWQSSADGKKLFDLPAMDYFEAQQPDTIDTAVELPFPFEDKSGDPNRDTQSGSPLYLDDPENVQTQVEYDTETGEYVFQNRIGGFDYRPPVTMSREEYSEFQLNEMKQDYWREKARSSEFNESRSFVPSFQINSEAFDKVFGSNTINVTPQGSAEVIFGFTMNRLDNPQLSERLRRTPSFTFKEKIQMNVAGSIGDKMELGINYNTEATFDFENKTKLEWVGEEDDIIKKIEAGNVTLPLSGSLITGSQSLFGLKTELQFGKLTMSSVFSHQKGESSVIEVEGGSQVNEFEISAGDYDANRHFFLSHYFREQYDQAMSGLPVIQSRIQIEEIEVWITNKTQMTEGSRNIVAFADLGEKGNNLTNPNIPIEDAANNYPHNGTNELYEYVQGQTDLRDIGQVTSVLEGWNGFSIGRDYEKIENARKLDPREYTLNKTLGYISLNSALNADEVLAVAYRYKVVGVNEYQTVGELTNNAPSAPQTIYVKLLKGTNLSPQYKTWDLMMKNIYAINAYQVNKQDFMLNILYQDDKNGQLVNYIPEERTGDDILLNVFQLDRLNNQNDPAPEGDGMFDFLPGLTIIQNNGRIIFPMVEPFGNHLEEYLLEAGLSAEEAAKYTYDSLYTSTKTSALQVAEKNKFFLAGEYKSSSGSEIQLNALNVPRGSVKVTAGGIQLTENVDYTVDYTLGRVKIINQGILESGTPIRISMESNTMFNLQTKTLVGTHLNYRFNDDFYLGGTILNLTERPLTKKVSFGDEPISNTIWGLNGSYRTEAPVLTALVDKIPLINTKEKSTITVDGEFAHLIPGSSRTIGKTGIAYIDDFEGSETSIDMKSFPAWVHASTPQGQMDKFPEAGLNNNLAYNFNRAKFAWYVIDDLFQENTSLTPSHIKSNPDLQSSHFVRTILEQEIFPNRESEHNIPNRIAVLNMAYYPTERGIYNFDTDGRDRFGNVYSAGMNAEGRLNEPQTRWGGIMREVITSDFETANIEYIEFWMMDPYAEDTTAYDNPGYLGSDPAIYFNLGNVSEDILKDSRKAFENGLPTAEENGRLLDTTAWGYVSRVQDYTTAFDTDIESRQYQDIGLDGLNTEEELVFFQDQYLAKLDSMYGINSGAYQQALQDPSNDDFHYFRGSDYDQQQLGILERYKDYNGLEENSRTAEQSDEEYSTTGKNSPDIEDINRDNTLSEAENYYQYKVSLRPDQLLGVGQNYITDVIEHNAKFKNGERSTVRWIQFKIPIEDFERKVGTIDDFKSIRFMRLYMHGIEREVILRFATLDLVRSEWRKYKRPLYESIEYVEDQSQSGNLDISAVNIEENANKEPVNYVLPPGFDREIDPSNPQVRQLNEQAMVLNITDLADGDARAGYKNVELDLRQYKKLKMEIHAEELVDNGPLEDGDLTAFIRIGSDYVNNFYEYEVPLKVTPPGNYSNNNAADREMVWPEENSMDIDLEMLVDAKIERDDAARMANSNINLTTIYETWDQKGNRVLVRGNPNLSNIRTIMIGVRNPKRPNDLKEENDGYPKSGEIWVNELRLTNFRDKGGWAANTRVRANLADFGVISFAGAVTTPGFGSIEQKVNERDKERTEQFDIATNLELGKFFPEKTGVTIPVYLGYSETNITPQYNPLEPDVPLQDALKNAASDAEVEQIEDFAVDKTIRKSFNVTNARINKSSAEKKLYDPSNFAVSYSYSEKNHRNINIQSAKVLDYRAAFSYNYSSRPKNVTPLSGLKFLSNPYLRLIKDFNFYYLPSRVSFRTDLNRQYREKQFRSLAALRSDDDIKLKMPVMVFKDYTWNRYYDLKWDLSKTLKLDFSATNMARFDESMDQMNDFGMGFRYDPDPEYGQNDFGRTLDYRHNIRASYTVPINKIPILSWSSLSLQYDANYNWQAGPVKLEDVDEDFPLGNTISNSSTFSINSSNRLTALYNKVGYFRNLEQKYSTRGRQQQPTEMKTIIYERDNMGFIEGRARPVNHKLGTEDIRVFVYNEGGQEIDADYEIVDEDKIRVTLPRNERGVRVRVEGEVEKKPNPVIFIAEQSVRLLLGFKDISGTYRESRGMIVPGYSNKTDILGNTQANGKLAPGPLFVMGWQQKDFIEHAMQEEWLSKNEFQLAPISNNLSRNLELRSTYEPFKGFRITFNANRNFTEIESRSFGLREDNTYGVYGFMKSGSFSMSMITWKTAFEEMSSDNDYYSPAFEKFKAYRRVISDRIATKFQEAHPGYNPKDTEFGYEPGYNTGFGSTSKEVLVPAFLAAYTGQSPERVTLDNFPQVPMPNWRLTFDGLTNIEFVKKLLRSVNVNHSYRSRYNIGSYSTNLEFNEDRITDNFNGQNNLITPMDVNSVSIEEQLAPLIGFDMTWLNSFNSRLEIKKTRSLGLNFANNQLIEVNNDELVIGAGYTIRDVELVIDAGSGQRAYSSDLNIRADLSIRDTKTILRNLSFDPEDDLPNEITAGEKRITMKTTMDYQLSDSFNVSFFFDRVMNTPATSRSFPYANTNIGFSVRFTLIQ